MRCDDRDRYGGVVLLDVAHHFETITIGKTHIGQTQVEVFAVDQFVGIFQIHR